MKDGWYVLKDVSSLNKSNPIQSSAYYMILCIYWTCLADWNRYYIMWVYGIDRDHCIHTIKISSSTFRASSLFSLFTCPTLASTNSCIAQGTVSLFMHTSCTVSGWDTRKSTMIPIWLYQYRQEGMHVSRALSNGYYLPEIGIVIAISV